MKQWLSTQKLIIGLMIIVFLGAFVSVTLATTQLVNAKQTRILTLERDAIALEIEQYFDTFGVALLALGEAIRLRPNDDVLQYDLMVDLKERYDSIHTVYYVTPDNTMINASDFIPPPDFMFTERPWYQAATEAQAVVATHAFLNASEDRLIVTLAYAVRQEATLIGVIAADIDIQVIRDVVVSKTIGQTGFAFLIDSQNHLLAHPDFDAEDLTLTRGEVIFGESTVEQNLKGVTVFTFANSGSRGALTTTVVYASQFTLGVFMPDAEFNASRQMALMISLSGVLILSAVMLGWIAFNHFYLNRPIQQLITDVERIDIHQNLTYRLPIQLGRIFNHLRQALNKTLDTTERYYSDKVQAEKALRLESQKLKLMVDSSEDILFQINPDKTFVWISGKKLAIFGHEPEYYIGKSIIEVFGDQGLERDRIYERVLKGSIESYQWHPVIEGEIITFASILSPVFDQNQHVIGAVGVSRDVTEQMHRHQEIEKLSYQDYLTDMNNRRYFSEALSNHDDGHHYPLGILMMDVNGLKIFNDVYGHDTGDALLRKIAQTLRHIIPKQHVSARIGGDEFAAIITHTSHESMVILQTTIIEKIATLRLKGVPLSVAVGFDIKYRQEEPITTVLKNAENRLYKHKLNDGKHARHQMIDSMFAHLLEAHPHEQGHADRVSELAVALGQAMNFNEERLKALAIAARYHDIGKVSLANTLLDKIGALSDEEQQLLQTHTEAGYLLLRAADEYASFAETALSHHERYDGLGYPRGLKGEQIPLFSRIVGLAEAYDAMTQRTPYRLKPLSNDEAVVELRTFAGQQFDPKLTEVFIKSVVSKFNEIRA